MLPLALLLAAAPLTTTAEQSGWVRTGRFSEVETLCAEFPKRYPGKVRCQQFGTSPEGRALLALIASDDGTLTAEACAKKKRPVVLVEGGIHAGEIDGKDAGFWLLREILDGKVLVGGLKKLTLVFVPVFNVDGHERFRAWNRPNQRGPEEMGFRVTSQNYNLNRDWAKADAPEMRAMLTLLHAFDPVMLVDLHVTDGAKFQHDVSITFEPLHSGPPPLRELGLSLQHSLFTGLTAKGHLPLGFYPSFVDDEKPESGFEYGVPPPRFGLGYWALSHRFSVLVETHSWKDYATRVKTTFDVTLGLLEAAARDGLNWRAAMNAVDLRRPETVALSWEVTGPPKTIDFLGYAYRREDSPVSGQKWLLYDETKPEVWKVPYRETQAPALEAKVPGAGYLIPVEQRARVEENLKAHGVRFEVLQELPAIELESFRAATVKFRQASYEGHQTAQVTGEWKADRRPFAKGALFVPSNQPHIEVVMALLEPRAPDSYVSWGLFNAHFEQKEYLEEYVAEEFARTALSDAGVKAEFDREMLDAGFAKSPSDRLRFFHFRHPSFDERFNLVPIFRVERKAW